MKQHLKKTVHNCRNASKCQFTTEPLSVFTHQIHLPLWWGRREEEKTPVDHHVILRRSHSSCEMKLCHSTVVSTFLDQIIFLYCRCKGQIERCDGNSKHLISYFDGLTVASHFPCWHYHYQVAGGLSRVWWSSRYSGGCGGPTDRPDWAVRRRRQLQ